MVLIFFSWCRQAVIIRLGLYSLGWWYEYSSKRLVLFLFLGTAFLD